MFAQPFFIDFVDGWLHLSIARASSALHSVRAAILHSSFFTLHSSFFTLHLKSLGAISRSERRHVRNSWAVPSET